QLRGGNGPGWNHPGDRELAFLYGDWAGIPVLDSACFRPLQSYPVPGGDSFVDAAAADWTEAIPRSRAVHRYFHHVDGVSPDCGEPAGSGAGGVARAVERARADGGTAVLGLAVGRDGIDPGDSYHCGDQGRVRPRRGLAAGGALA